MKATSASFSSSEQATVSSSNHSLLIVRKFAITSRSSHHIAGVFKDLSGRSSPHTSRDRLAPVRFARDRCGSLAHLAADRAGRGLGRQRRRGSWQAPALARLLGIHGRREPDPGQPRCVLRLLGARLACKGTRRGLDRRSLGLGGDRRDRAVRAFGAISAADRLAGPPRGRRLRGRAAVGESSVSTRRWCCCRCSSCCTRFRSAPPTSDQCRSWRAMRPPGNSLRPRETLPPRSRWSWLAVWRSPARSMPISAIAPMRRWRWQRLWAASSCGQRAAG